MAGEEITALVKGKLLALLDSAKAAVADKKLTFSEAVALVKEAIGSAIEIADQLPEAGPERKALVLSLCDQLYTTVIAPIDIPFVPNIVVEPIVDASLGKLFHEICSGIIEGDLRILRRRQAVAAAAVGSAAPQ